MKNLVIAKRYAKALFTLAREAGSIEEYGQELGEFRELLTRFPDFAQALRNPLYPEAVRKSLFVSVTQDLGMTPIMKSFLTLLIEKGRIQNLDEIAECYRSLIDEYSNVARARVRAATELDGEILDEMAETLGKMTGKKIVVEFEQDPSLIGGVVAQIGDLVLDGSVRRQLLTFKETLKRGALA